MVGTPANDLNISQAGYVVFDGVSTFTGRTFQAGAGITITNASGVAGNTTISLVGGSGAIEHLTGNDAVVVNPDGANNINVVGTGSITTIGSLNTETISLTGLTNHAVLVGAGTATITKIAATANTGAVLQNNSGSDPSYSTATYPSTTTINQILYSNAANSVIGLATANQSVLTTGSSGVPILTALAVNGQLIIGSTAGVPAAATLTAGTGITITNGSNSITIATSATGTINTLTGNTGGAISPTAGNINTLGTGSITIAGSGSTLTTQLTGLTNHAIQIGAGTATLTQLGAGTTGQVLQTNTGADPTWSTATYPSTTTINQILFSSAANTVTGITAGNQSVLTSSTTGVPSWTSIATNGQLIIGSTAGNPAAATLTAGTGITITNGSNSITIAASATSFTWQTITASQTLVKNNGYMCISAGGALALALPSTVSSTIGDTIIVTLDGATSWSITQAASQQIRVSSAQTTAGASGSVTSTAQGDSITLVYQATGRWNAYQFTGNLTVA